MLGYHGIKLGIELNIIFTRIFLPDFSVNKK